MTLRSKNSQVSPGSLASKQVAAETGAGSSRPLITFAILTDTCHTCLMYPNSFVGFESSPMVILGVSTLVFHHYA